MLSIQIIETKIDIIGNYPDQRHFKFEAPIPDENNQTLFKRFFFTQPGLWSVDPDPHGSASISPGSRRGKFEGKNIKNARKIEDNCNFIIKY